jgi:hypothetical protein
MKLLFEFVYTIDILKLLIFNNVFLLKFLITVTGYE